MTLYQYFLNSKFTKETHPTYIESSLNESLISRDIERTDLRNAKFKIDYKTGGNALYNVLYAYAHFDPGIGYCQGMNVIASWLLKFL